MKKMNMILSICQDTIKEKNLLLIIDDIYKNIASVYDNIRESSIESASQAIHSAYSNKDQQFNTEILVAVSHLRFAFNISKEALGLKRRYSYFFGLMSGIEDLLNYSEKLLIEDCLCGLSGVIAILYREVGKIDISEEWIEVSIKYYKKNINFYHDFSLENIQKEHLNFVYTKYGESEEVVETNHITGDYMTITKDYEYLALTPEGEKYVKGTKDKLLEQYRELLRTIKIV
jgi:hypothetical protein